MDKSRPGNPKKFLTLEEASKRLGFTVETLLEWNKLNILTPTISEEGFVGYEESQLEQFSKIRGSLTPDTAGNEADSDTFETNSPLNEEPGRAVSQVEQSVVEEELLPPPPASEGLSLRKLIELAGNGFYEDEYSKQYYEEVSKPADEKQLVNFNFNFNSRRKI